MMDSKFRTGQHVYFVTNDNKLISGIITGWTDYTSGKNPVLTLERPSVEGFMQVVLTEPLQKRCALEND